MEIEAVLDANGAFYEAFVDRDVAAMDEIWARDLPVACIHPGWDVLLDRQSIMASWAKILADPSSPSIESENPTAHLFDDVAFVVCHEVIRDHVLVATNVFAKESGEWRMVHHQAGPMAVSHAEPAPRIH